MAPNDVKTVSVQLTAAQAQQVLRTVEKDPDSGNWGEGNKVRNEVTAAFRSALGSAVSQESEQVEAAQEPEVVEDDVAPEEPAAEPEPVPATPSSEVDVSDDAADGQLEDDESVEADRS